MALLVLLDMALVLLLPPHHLDMVAHQLLLSRMHLFQACLE
jgi:hypothetical protein